MTAVFDQERVDAFVGTVLGNATGLTTTLLAGLGDRLGLWTSLAEGGPATSAELAARAGIDERYAQEWWRL